MANYTLANLVKAQVALNGAFAAAEKRYRTPEALLTYLRSNRSFYPQYETLRTREDRTLEANYFVRQSRALGSARSHNHTGAHGDSGVLTPSWATYADTFASTLKQSDNSVFSAQEELNDRLTNVFINMIEGLDTAAVNHAFSNRTGVNVAVTEGTFNATQDAFEITETTNGTRAMQITKMVMNINKYAGVMLTIMCDSVSYNKFQYQAAQGVSNATNTSFQFQGVSFVHAPELDTLAAGLASPYTKGFWLAVPEGMIGALPWIPKQNRQGIVTSVNMYGSILNPIDGLQYAVHSYETRADGTSVNGRTQDVLTEVQVSIDLAFDKAPLSTANATPIFAFALV